MANYLFAGPVGWPRETDAQRADARYGHGTTTELRSIDGSTTVWRGKKALTHPSSARCVA